MCAIITQIVTKEERPQKVNQQHIKLLVYLRLREARIFGSEKLGKCQFSKISIVSLTHLYYDRHKVPKYIYSSVKWGQKYIIHRVF